jgi:hypothetical protein
MRLAFVAAAALLLTATAASAAQVTREATIDAEPAKVWAEIGSFCSISAWHPAIAKCEEIKTSDATMRHLTTGDGGMFEERLLAHDDKAMSYSYAILKSPLPVSDYQSTISVAEKDGKSQVVWKSSFEPKGVSAAEAEKVVGGIYEAGLDALKSKVK